MRDVEPAKMKRVPFTGIRRVLEKANALEGPQDSLHQMLRGFDRRRLLLYNGLQELGIPCSRSQAAFYLFPDISEFGMDSFAFAELLLEQYGVATVPGVEFGRNGENHLRISYATSYEDCQEGLRRIGQCVRDLRSK